MAGEAKYRIGTVSKMTGLSTHTLRMWEQRFAAVLPTRVQAGGRLYTDADVERLRLLHRVVSAGHPIGRMARLPDADLRQMAASVPSPSSEPISWHLPEVRGRVLSAFEELQTEQAQEILAQAALSTEPAEFLKTIVGPILVEVGDRWDRGELRIAHEHACSAVMRGLLFSLLGLYPTSNPARRVVVTTPANEEHELGALMVAMLAAMHEWSVLYLGPNLPADEIAYAVTRTKSQLLVLSITHLTPAESQQEIDAIETAISEHVNILVGGGAAKAPPGSRAEIRQDLALAEATLTGHAAPSKRH
jgi:DNA-binding transcriptional MerR regulator/methylmalonyl-CoA mutase cobalamin-binding subunit